VTRPPRVLSTVHGAKSLLSLVLPESVAPVVVTSTVRVGSTLGRLAALTAVVAFAVVRVVLSERVVVGVAARSVPRSIRIVLELRGGRVAGCRGDR